MNFFVLLSQIGLQKAWCLLQVPGPFEDRPLWGQTPVLGQAPWGLARAHQRNPGFWAFLNCTLTKHRFTLGDSAGFRLAQSVMASVASEGTQAKKEFTVFLPCKSVCMISYTEIPQPLAKILKISVHLCIITWLPTLQIMWKIHPTKILRLTINDTLISLNVFCFKYIKIKSVQSRNSGAPNYNTSVCVRAPPCGASCLQAAVAARGTTNIWVFHTCHCQSSCQSFLYCDDIFKKLCLNVLDKLFRKASAYKGPFNRHARMVQLMICPMYS